MSSRQLPRVAVAGAVLAAGIAVAAPASASVTYDPETRTGFVGGDDVRNAFGWTDAKLVSRASGVIFDHDFWTDDTYTVACGGPAFPVVHHRQFGRYELAGTVAHAKGRAAALGYRGTLTGFRLTGARSGISGTSVPPAVGGTCPEEDPARPAGTTINRVRLVSSATGWALAARSGDVRRELVASGTPQR